MTYVKPLMMLAALCGAGAAPAGAAPLVCQSSHAWRLEAGGLVSHNADFYGYAETAALSADTDAGTLSAGGEVIAPMHLRSRPDTETGADLVFSADDGSMLFRARQSGQATVFLLIDAYDVYTGTCGK